MTVSRTVVLVHGAWHGSWCWAPVVSRLDAAGRRSVTVDLPSVSSTAATLPDDVACVRAVLDALDGDALLVGHSYGGVVVTDAGVHPARRARRLPDRVRARAGRVGRRELVDRR